MVAVRMENFGGMVPLMSRRLLPENMAASAANAYLRAGEIRGIRRPVILKEFLPLAWVFVNGVLMAEEDYTFATPGVIALNRPLADDARVVVIAHTIQNGVVVVPYWRTRFAANAGQTTFPLIYTPGTISVYVNGVLLNESEYTATDGLQVVLAVPIIVDSVVEVMVHNTSAIVTPTGGTKTSTITRMDVLGSTGAGNAVFSAGYTPGMERVYVNGVLQTPGVDYTAIDGMVVTLITPAANDDVVTVVARLLTATDITNLHAVYTRTVIDALAGTSQIDLVGDVSDYLKAIRIPDPTAPEGVVWYQFVSRHADIFPNPMVNDAFDRYIWLDNNGPGSPQYLQQNSLARIKDGYPPFRLGVPAPTAAPTVVASGGSTVTVTRAYVYTYVNIFNEEGAPSPADVETGFIDGTWTVSGLVNPADAATRGINRVRIYRSVTGANGTTFFLVAEQVVTDPDYVDTRLDSEIAAEGILLQSTTWAEPEMMEGFIAMPNGFFAGWRGRDVFFSEPYRPWAWPAEYITSVQYDVVDAGVLGQTLVLLTAVQPTFMTGVTPIGMTVERPSANEPCLNAVSVAAAPEGIYFSGSGGLMLLSSVGTQLVTKDVVSRERWQSHYAPKIRSAVAFDSQYVAIGIDGDGFIFDPRTLQSGVIDIVNFEQIDNIWSDPYTTEAHLMIANRVCQWSAPTAPFATAEWLSKEFQFIKPVNFGAMIVYLDPAYEIDESLEIVPVPPGEVHAVGGPWPEMTSIVNYNLVNGATINTNPLDGDTPPGNPGSADVWPYWYGVVSDTTEEELPDGATCRITVYAGSKVVWRKLVENARMYRLPSGFKSALWQINVQTKVGVMNIQIAENPKELVVV